MTTNFDRVIPVPGYLGSEKNQEKFGSQSRSDRWQQAYYKGMERPKRDRCPLGGGAIEKARGHSDHAQVWNDGFEQLVSGQLGFGL